MHVHQDVYACVKSGRESGAMQASHHTLPWVTVQDGVLVYVCRDSVWCSGDAVLCNVVRCAP